ncbi:MAG: hypothetical protein CO093_05335 [Alphaproteobacteria bacterium CG_4_9_14_3_um_filter_47_13]|nr:MAG: hypothetical protein CO093_05335 [Alphaproteobacteria bacterium CG_4_9_14_3_um_filter_47_13]
MWDEAFFYSLVGLGIIALLLTYKCWGSVIYFVTTHWRVAGFILIGSLFGVFIVLKQQDLKYELAYYYFTGTKNTGELQSRYQIRQCREFILAKIKGEEVADDRHLTAGFINISTISNWEFCARTFGLNYWKHDITINGQNGGRLLCEAYARDTYRSDNVQIWCDTVFSPAATTPESASGHSGSK